MRDVEDIISHMTLEEKASLCSGLDAWHLKGVARLGIPSIMVTDGPHGLRKQRESAGDEQGILSGSVPATCFPTASALAATWNRDLLFEVGQALGEECRQEEAAVILGPGVNIKRSPLCGRNFEYYSEDPYLTGELAKSFIRGVQSQGIGTSVKHYAANNQESRRMTVDTLVDERTLREIYLTGFEIAVKDAQPWTVMCSYNRINGTYASDHRYLIGDILKGEWGLQGLVMTDWGAMNERVTALQAGVDLEMPGVRNGSDARIVAAVRSGALAEAVLDRAVARILTLILRAQATLATDAAYDPQAHHALARRVAGEGVVLLKNAGHLLPIKAGARIALIGRFAKSPRYQGAGSSIMNPTQLDNLYTELRKLVGEDHLTWAAGYTDKGDTVDEALIQDALGAAGEADVVVICAGLTDMYEVEGIDRSDMQLPAGHGALIQRLAAVHPNVVVVLSNGSPVEMPWANDVPAIVEGYLGGQAGAGALADILTGLVNPSGRLAETFPLSLHDTPAQPYPGGPSRVEYRESIYVGYRYYDTADVEVLFPFGHGLSYTTFAYRDLALTQARGTVTATFWVKNAGSVAGKEIAQVYVRDVESTAFRPRKELKGFAKVALGPGEEAEIAVPLGRRAFAFYDTGSKEWVVEAGDFEIAVGASSRDIRLTGRVHLADGYGTVSSVDRPKLAAYYEVSRDRRFTQADFEALRGHPLPPPLIPRKGTYTLNTPICDMKDSFIARQISRLLGHLARKRAGSDGDTPMAAMTRTIVAQMPLRTLLMYRVLDRPRLEALLQIINGHVIKGLMAFIQAGSSADGP